MSALRAFEAAAQALSFRKAAEQLHRTPSAISHQIRRLETELGSSLFHRETRGLRLTDAGRTYLETVRSSLDQLAEASTRLRRVHGATTITLSLFPSLAVRWLIPRLGDFRERHPDIEIELVSSVRESDFDHGAIDAAIRFGAGEWAGMRCDPLMAEERFPVCTPSVARGPPTLGAPSDLVRATLLHNGAHPGEWSQWLADAGVTRGDVANGSVFDASNEVLAAAANGLGVALGRSPLVEPDLASGRLVEPFDGRLVSSGRYWLVAPTATAGQHPLVALRSWLQIQADID